MSTTTKTSREALSDKILLSAELDFYRQLRHGTPSSIARAKERLDAIRRFKGLTT